LLNSGLADAGLSDDVFNEFRRFTSLLTAVAGALAGLRSFIDFERSGNDFRLSVGLSVNLTAAAACGGRVAVTRPDWGFGGLKISILEPSLSLSSSLLLISITTFDRPRVLLAEPGSFP